MKRIFLSLWLCFIPHIAMADMECGKETISLDYEETWTMEKVKILCGPPSSVKYWDEEIVNQQLDNILPTKKTENYSIWTYDRGKSIPIVYLIFKNDVLIDIKDKKD